MNWKVRHEGSPSFVEMPFEQLIQGLADGQWEPTDEVMGPGEKGWTAIEAHPKLEEIAAELEPPPPRTYDDETRLDMNALIDVTLVLLVFFILTTTVAALQTRLEAPSAEGNAPKVKVVTKQQVQNQMILCSAKMESGQAVVRVEDKITEPEALARAFRGYVRSSGKTTLLIEHDDNVPQDIVVKIIDAAKGAGIERVSLVVP
jgi:biopolymer transport protein ExbD